MRILSVIPYPILPPRGGGALRCWHVLRELARAGEVHAVIFQRLAELRAGADGYALPETVRPYSPLDEPPPRTAFDRLPRRLGRALHYRWLRRSLRGPADAVLLRSWHLVERILREQPIDAAVFEHTGTMMAAPLVRRVSPATVRILDAHNVDCRLLEQECRAASPAGRLDRRQRRLIGATRWTETHLHRFVDAAWACSDADRDVLVALNRGRVRGFTIPNGVDTQRLACADAAPSSAEVLFCGSLNYAPNVDGLEWFARDIWPRIAHRCPRARLVVVGRGAAPDAFASLRRDDRVEFAGEVPDVAPYYRRAAVAVCPLRAGSGTRLKILEAMSLGTPVVSTRLGAEGIDLRHGEHALLADEPDSFAEQTAAVLRDPSLWRRLRLAAREQAERRYDWRVVGQAMQQSLQQLCAGGAESAPAPRPVVGAAGGRT